MPDTKETAESGALPGGIVDAIKQPVPKLLIFGGLVGYLALAWLISKGTIPTTLEILLIAPPAVVFLVLGLLLDPTLKTQFGFKRFVPALVIAVFVGLLFAVVPRLLARQGPQTHIDRALHILATVFFALLCIFPFYMSRQLRMLKAAASSLNTQLGKLEQEREKLISGVEDATRSVLRGFPAIFEKMCKMISQAQRELWMINFTVKFGAPHVQNSELVGFYKKKGKDLQKEVNDFLNCLLGRLQLAEAAVKDVNILTVTRKGADKNFLSLLNTNDYKALSDETIGRNGKTVKDNLLDEIEQAKERVLDTSGARRAWSGGSSTLRLFEVESLPIQLLVVGLKDNRTGCLVFMVGTEVLLGRQEDNKAERDATGGENQTGATTPVEAMVGFYTELDTVVDIYKDLARALMKQPIPEQCRRTGY
jgi:hypothetical protein